MIMQTYFKEPTTFSSYTIISGVSMVVIKLFTKEESQK